MSEWARSGYEDPRCNNSLRPGAPRIGICTNWTDWPTAQIQDYMTRQGVNVLPIANGIEWGADLPCGGHMELNGAAFVNGENPPTTGCQDCYTDKEAQIRRVVAVAKQVGTVGGRAVKTS